MDKSKDQDRGKGAMEQDQQNQRGNTSMQGQLGHRDEDEELKDAALICPGETCCFLWTTIVKSRITSTALVGTYRFSTLPPLDCGSEGIL